MDNLLANKESNSAPATEPTPVILTSKVYSNLKDLNNG